MFFKDIGIKWQKIFIVCLYPGLSDKMNTFRARPNIGLRNIVINSSLIFSVRSR